MTGRTGEPGWTAPRGMRDFYPDAMARRNRVFDAWKRAAQQFGFQEYDACVVETLDLLQRKSGEEIVRQIYAFEDKSGRKLALRPEMTPTLARMVAARQNSLSFPLKWFAIAQCFRYERMTRGRKREHYQWNLDIVGENDVSAEAEVIACAVHALRLLDLGSSDLQVRFSSRALLGDMLAALRVPESRHAEVFLALDKMNKVDESVVQEWLEKAGVAGECRTRILELMRIRHLPDTLHVLTGKTPAYLAAERLLELMARYGLSDMVSFDVSVVRGLNYYTGIVFEAFDRDGAFRALFGGGRYDTLLAETGGAPIGAVGLGFGDVVLGEILGQRSGAGPGHAVDLAVAFMNEEQRAPAMRLAQALRHEGRSVELGLRPEKAKAFFSRAVKTGASEAAFIGPDDLAAGCARIKNLHTRQEHTRTLP